MSESTKTTESSGLTWTAYPSLLGDLRNDDQRAAIEEAACATQCGRYEDAAWIYEHLLPSSDSLAVLTLNHADTLTNQGLERARKQLLERSLQNDSKLHCSAASHLLLELMLADVNFWVLGEINGAVLLLARVREYFAFQSIMSLVDVELRCITLYYSMIKALQTCCNELGIMDLTVFAQYKGDRAVETSELRKVLQQQARWRFAPSFMQLELSFAGNSLQNAVRAAHTLSAQLDMPDYPAIRFRNVVLLRQVASVLSTILPPLSVEITVKYTSILTAIAPEKFATWQAYCPFVAMNQRSATIADSELTTKEHVQAVRALIQEASEGGDYTMVNQLYIAVRNMIQKWVNEVRGNGIAEAFHVMFEVGLEYLDLHDTITGMAYFEAAGLSDYLTNLYVHRRDHDEILRRVEGFFATHRQFEIPSTSERLYERAQQAALDLKRSNLRNILLRKQKSALLRCHFYAQGGGLTNEAVSDPDYCFRVIAADGNDPLDCGINAIKLMVLWATYEYSKNLLSTQALSHLFDMTLLGVEVDLLGLLGAEETPKKIFESMCGLEGAPASRMLFSRSFNRLFRWIVTPDRSPSRSARLYALKMLLRARVYLYNAFLIGRRSLPAAEHAEELRYETARLLELEKMEAIENHVEPNQAEEELVSQIHMTLVKSFVPSSPPLVTDSELVERAANCRTLITLYSNRGTDLKHYHTLCQLIRLTWQRFVKFKSVKPETVVEIATDAEAVYVKIRQAMSGPEPSSDLLAKIKLSTDFQYREHHNFALTGLFAAQETLQTSALEDQLVRQRDFVGDLARWSIISKGRSLLDALLLQEASLKTDASVERQESSNPMIRGREIEVQLDGLRMDDQSPESSPQKFDNATDIQDLLKLVPDAIFVDYINVVYRIEGPTLVALVHRKSFPIRVYNLSISLDQVDQWVETNLDTVRTGRDHSLMQAGALEKMGELKHLMQPFLVSSGDSVIPSGVPIIVCPTGSLHRVPIHAISVGEGPLIEQHPVVYTQSFRLLHSLWSRYPKSTDAHSTPHRVVLNPLPSSQESDSMVRQLAIDLKADEVFRGFDLHREEVVKNMNHASIFHYHGHAFYNSQTALDSALLLNEFAYKKAADLVGKLRKPKEYEALTARDILDDVKMAFPALATLVGCSSGVGEISSTDDVLGLPTALLYAGASSVVSTLWDIDDRDGADFATVFYAELRAIAANTPHTKAAWKHSLNLAKAMQAAILNLRGDSSRTQFYSPYRWAAFVLQGLWVIPEEVFGAA